MTQVLQVGGLMPDLTAELKSRYGAQALEHPTPQAWESLATRLGGPAGITLAVTSGATGVPGWLMNALPDLQAIVNFGVGYDSTDSAHAKARGVVLSNTPDVLTDCVADTAVGLVLTSLRRLTQADQFVREGGWASGESFPLTTRVTGKRFGILGLGRIGYAVAIRLEGFNGIIGYHNRNTRSDVPYTYYPTPTALAEASDVLIIAAPGGESSRGLVDRAVLKALGPSGFVINVGRGSIINEPDLIAALENGEIAGAGLDTFAQEPAVPQALLHREDVVLLPHLASGTLETRAAMRDLVLQNVESYLATGRLITPVQL